MIFRLVCFVLVTLLCAPRSRAQTVEYEIPTEYHLVPGHLSVAFGDTVSAARARAIVFAEGYLVASYAFEPVRVALKSTEEASEEELAALNRHPDVVGVQQMDFRHLFADEPMPEGFKPFGLYVQMRPTMTREAARALAEALVPSHTVDQVVKRPNEVVVTVDEGTEARALEALEAHPEVRYVAYVNAE